MLIDCSEPAARAQSLDEPELSVVESECFLKSLLNGGSLAEQVSDPTEQAMADLLVRDDRNLVGVARDGDTC